MQVLIPIGRIKEVNESQNVNKAEQKYIEIVTEDDSEFFESFRCSISSVSIYYAPQSDLKVKSKDHLNC